MTDDQLIWRIAGGSGDGIETTSRNFAKALMRSGLDVFTHRHYPSRIRGGHTYVEVRAGEGEVRSRGDGYNVLLALGDSFARNPQEEAYYGDEELKPLYENFDELREGGVIVYDSGLIDEEDVEEIGLHEKAEENDWHVYPVDLRSIAKEHGREIMRNNAGIGVLSNLLDFETEGYEEVIGEAYNEEITEANRKVIADGAAAADEFDEHPDFEMPTGDGHEEPQALISGSDAIAYGALDAGCRFIAGYPMTPWTDVFTIMSQNLPKFGGISEQVEDEIAAAALAIGASHTGVKAMSGSRRCGRARRPGCRPNPSRPTSNTSSTPARATPRGSSWRPATTRSVTNRSGPPSRSPTTTRSRRSSSTTRSSRASCGTSTRASSTGNPTPTPVPSWTRNR
jgi:pyruvate ferredoxin oxidoreductase alpha subunit